MIRNRLKWIRAVSGGLALMAALACSIMPGGLIPKVAGRCGRALCSCEPEPFVEHCQLCHTNAAQHGRSKGSLTLSTTSISGVDAPGLAFQVVFGGVLAPQTQVVPQCTQLAERMMAESSAFALHTVSADIVLPPPKA